MLQDLYSQAYLTGKISQMTLKWLSATPMDSISQSEQRMVQRLLHAVRRGWLTVVDEPPYVA